ncbi:hypothetical protein EJ06DRAFT_531938 [Trichodelitschia bisporula]|uniref:Uncharacterized protein n=1 Tax=Trichodelitschia bisporula TaxID=703511 RepID=A0A6G1HS72_9PEZI|nr:hypothetical protein EJ06DRAFT_531938 [Trichodelitschia bisporula]
MDINRTFYGCQHMIVSMDSGQDPRLLRDESHFTEVVYSEDICPMCKLHELLNRVAVEYRRNVSGYQAEDDKAPEGKASEHEGSDHEPSEHEGSNYKSSDHEASDHKSSEHEASDHEPSEPSSTLLWTEFKDEDCGTETEKSGA